MMEKTADGFLDRIEGTNIYRRVETELKPNGKIGRKEVPTDDFYIRLDTCEHAIIGLENLAKLERVVVFSPENFEPFYLFKIQNK